jgi:hypothetical protein
MKQDDLELLKHYEKAGLKPRYELEREDLR